jgi:Fic family protein
VKPGAWPAQRVEIRPWRQAQRGGSRDDRMLREIAVSLPAHIADAPVPIDAELAARLEDALRDIADLDATRAPVLEPLRLLLLRTESVASSKIESVEASLDDYARALHGVRANPSAVSMVAATGALDRLISRHTPGDHAGLDAILDAHAVLMADDRSESAYGGRLRDMQNWIGGSDHSPLGAVYVPPPPETVEAYMEDLLAFVNRDDVPALAQAAITHAQFEAIHPFTDGNGRIGRALINTVLRRRGATRSVVVPLASALVARRDRYFDLLTGYGRGHLRPLLLEFATAAVICSRQSLISATRLESVPGIWRSQVGPARRGSATAALLDLLLSRPILTSESAAEAIGASSSAVSVALNRLLAAGVLRPLTDRKRDQVWGAAAVLDELEALNVRIAAATRAEP